MLDVNDQERKDVEYMTRKAGMRDLHVYQHGTKEEPETHIRGSKRIDFMYGTPLVLESLRKSDIGAYGEFCISDHRHLFADLDLEWMLGGKAPNIVSANRRILNTQSPRHMKKYREV